jgi:distribution and morphology protein 31
MKGVRGTVDQSNLSWDLQDWNPATNRQYHLDTLDFTLEGFQLEDATLSVKLPKQYKSYVLSVFQASVPNMRSKWMLYDLLSAGTVVGLFDGCLFSVHRAQRDEADMFVAAVDVDSDHEQGKIRKRQVSHLRIDGVNIEHLNAGVSGPFGWITSGTVDMSAHICFPVERTDVALKELLLKLKEKVDDITTDPERIFRKATWEDVIEEPNVPQGSPFVMDLFVRFNDIKATMPSLLSAHDVSYRDHALMRPLVGYMNWNRVSIPVQCRMALDLGKFEGAWTIYDADLPNLMSERIGLAMAKSMADERKRQQHLRRVGLWGVQSVTRNLISLWEYTGNVRTPWTSMGWL